MGIFYQCHIKNYHYRLVSTVWHRCVLVVRYMQAYICIYTHLYIIDIFTFMFSLFHWIAMHPHKNTYSYTCIATNRICQYECERSYSIHQPAAVSRMPWSHSSSILLSHCAINFNRANTCKCPWKLCSWTHRNYEYLKYAQHSDLPCLRACRKI